MPELQLHFTILFPGLMEFPLFHCLHRTQNGALKSVSSRISTLANTVWITSNFDKHPVPFHIQESLHSTASSVVSFTPHIWSPPQSLFIMLSLRTVSLSAVSTGIFLEMSALIPVVSFPYTIILCSGLHFFNCTCGYLYVCVSICLSLCSPVITVFNTRMSIKLKKIQS